MPEKQIVDRSEQALCSEANRIAAKARREARRSQLPRLLSASHPPLPTCPICQRAFRARIGIAGHLRTQCAISPPTSTPSTTLAPDTNPAPTTTLVTNFKHHQHPHLQVHTCPHRVHTCTPHIGLANHLRINRTETGEPVSGAPTYTRRTRLHRPQCTRTFMHLMGLFSHMRVHENLR
ncbi:hypothetical protein SprV_0100221000 [Sparganum proliferum]